MHPNKGVPDSSVVKMSISEKSAVMAKRSWIQSDCVKLASPDCVIRLNRKYNY